MKVNTKDKERVSKTRQPDAREFLIKSSHILYAFDSNLTWRGNHILSVKYANPCFSPCDGTTKHGFTDEKWLRVLPPYTREAVGHKMKKSMLRVMSKL